MTPEPAENTISRLRAAWAEQSGNNAVDARQLLLEAKSRPEELLALIAADAGERHARGLPASVDHYEGILANLRDEGELVDQILMSELVAASPHGVDEVQRRLQKRFPEFAERIALLSEFCEMAEPHEDPLDAVAHFDLIAPLGEGAFGRVYKAFDRDLRRFVALKVVPFAAATSREQAESFLNEARCAASVDHPNVVRVHAAGLDRERRLVWIDSQLAASEQDEGDITSRSLDRVHDARHSHPETAARLMLQIASGVAALHEASVIHRDLKPANVLLDLNGKPMIADFGLAAAAGLADPQHPSRNATVDSLVSLSDGVIGTPAFMAPEQARGEKATEASDIYGLGALLRWLLTGRAPVTAPPGARDPVRAVLDRVRKGDVDTLEDAHRIPPALQLIAAKAMAPRSRDRYASAAALAADIDRFLSHRICSVEVPTVSRVVGRALRRHRGVAIAVAASVILLATLMTAFFLSLERQVREFEQMADSRRATELVGEAARLWPARSWRAAEMRRWIRDVRALVARRDLHQDALSALESMVPEDSSEVAPEKIAASHATVVVSLEESEKRVEWLRRRVSATAGAEQEEFRHDLTRTEQRRDFWRGRATVARPPGMSGDAEILRWRRDVKTALLRQIDHLESLVPEMERRLKTAETLAQTTVVDEAKAWNVARRRVAQDERFHGFVLEPTVGLVPLGPDRRSGLEEFVQVETGTRPTRDNVGRLELEESTGCVLVLLPGGRFTMGTSSNPDSEVYDPNRYPSEEPAHTLTLEPFFVGKHEVTQAQWRRGGNLPQSWWPYKEGGGNPDVSGIHPVEHVDWEEAAGFANRFELRLLTEAQWEFACRGGTTTPWWTGSTSSSLRGAANLKDVSHDRATTGEAGREERLKGSVPWSDGHPHHAPVDFGRQNPFGLFGMLGNVSEWCRDFHQSYECPTSPGDGWRLSPVPSVTYLRVVRGGDFSSDAIAARSGARRFMHPESPRNIIGFRVMRPARSH